MELMTAIALWVGESDTPIWMQLGLDGPFAKLPDKWEPPAKQIRVPFQVEKKR
jgi:hypothetical protein